MMTILEEVLINSGKVTRVSGLPWDCRFGRAELQPVVMTESE